MFTGPARAPGTGIDGAAVSDGRLARGDRTRRRLAEALVSLLEEGDPQPTAQAVATRAGVSLRLVFHHFADMEGVLGAAVAVQGERHWRQLRPMDPALSRRRRIELLVRQRAELFEAVGPVRRAAARVEHTSAVLARELARSRSLLRDQLMEAFAPELDGVGSRRQEVICALEMATSWESWDQLRRHMGLAPPAARRLVRTVLGVLLAQAGPRGRDRGGDTTARQARRDETTGGSP